MKHRSRSHTSRKRGLQGRNLFWIGYSGVFSGITVGSGVVQSQTLVDPRVFEPGGEASTYGKDTNRAVVTILRQRLDYSLVFVSSASGTPTTMDFYMGVGVGAVIAPPASPALSAEVDQSFDWMDLWFDVCPNTAVSTASFKTQNGVSSRDIRTKRLLRNDFRSFLQFNIVRFQPTGGDPIGPIWTCQYLYRALCASNN